jgi:hypothetical protein
MAIPTAVAVVNRHCRMSFIAVAAKHAVDNSIRVEARSQRVMRICQKVVVPAAVYHYWERSRHYTSLSIEKRLGTMSFLEGLTREYGEGNLWQACWKWFLREFNAWKRRSNHGKQHCHHALALGP